MWLAVGFVIAFLLLANAVRDYRFVSRVLATQQVRHQMTQIASQVEQVFRRSEINEHPLQSVLGSTLYEGDSVKLRDADGVILEQVGSTLTTPSFTSAQERDAFARREALFRTFSTPEGDFVMEVFALHPSRRSRPDTAPGPSPTGKDLPGPRFLTLEIALPLQSADVSSLSPIRRNLIINLAAALALLATVILAEAGLRSYIKGRRLEEQIEIARQVQSKLLPDPLVQVPGIEIATVYKPSEEVGGDFYDVFPNETDGFAAVIGDVSGKGFPAALLMGLIHGAVRTAAWRDAEAGHREELKKLNRLLRDRASGNRFASMFWCVFDAHRHSLRYVNAGHCPPFLISRSAGAPNSRRLEEGGPVLGLLPEAEYQATSITIAPGDMLVMYSDGLIEATNTVGEEYGEDRLDQLLRAHFDDSALDTKNTLLNAWKLFSPATHTQDDLTFTIIRF